METIGSLQLFGQLIYSSWWASGSVRPRKWRWGMTAVSGLSTQVHTGAYVYVRTSVYARTHTHTNCKSPMEAPMLLSCSYVVPLHTDGYCVVFLAVLAVLRRMWPHGGVCVARPAGGLYKGNRPFSFWDLCTICSQDRLTVMGPRTPRKDNWESKRHEWGTTSRAMLSLLLWNEAELFGDLLRHLSCLVSRLACEDFCLLCH